MSTDKSIFADFDSFVPYTTCLEISWFSVDNDNNDRRTDRLLYPFVHAHRVKIKVISFDKRVEYFHY